MYSGVIISPEGKLRAEKSMVFIRDKVDESKNPRNVFVVHGRDIGLRDALFQFLQSLDLHPLEWSELVQSTGTGAPYVGEVLDKAFEEAQAIIVLMTPDDEGCLREHFREKNEPLHENELTPQPRLNVIFEAGIAMGRCPQRTILVEVGTLRPFSDIAGRHTVRLDNGTAKRKELAQRLKTAGCAVKTDGDAWLKAGTFKVSQKPKTPKNKSYVVLSGTNKGKTGIGSLGEFVKRMPGNKE